METKEVSPEAKQLRIEEDKVRIKEFFDLTVKVLKKYMDMEEEQYHVIAAWVGASLFINDFETFPILFINAQKRSGKTRLLKLMNALIPDSVKVVSMSEASLFRLPKARKVGAFLIDEAERLGSKEKANLRELINSAYKKGSKILRAKKLQSGNYEIEEFDIYVPLAMANISGVDEVIEDKCVSIILERSKKLDVVNRPELFEFDENIAEIVSLVQFMSMYKGVSYVYRDVCSIYSHTNNTNTTNDTNNTHNNTNTYYTYYTNFIKRIKENEIISRELEIWLPLLCTSWLAGEEHFDAILEYAKKEKQAREETELVEDRDSSLLVFLANFIADKSEADFISISDITQTFKLQDPDALWLNSRWLGRAIKRLRVAKEKRRMAKGVEVMLNFKKIEKKVEDLGVDLEKLREETEPKEETQTDLKEQPDWKDRKEAGEF